jgi:pimeloyl-ACP methyl ester carboxylesterase
VLVAQAAAYRSAIAAVRSPAVVVHGQLDRLLPSTALQQLTALQPDWPVHHLDGVGHSPHMEAPARTAAAIIDFLEAST